MVSQSTKASVGWLFNQRYYDWLTFIGNQSGGHKDMGKIDLLPQLRIGTFSLMEAEEALTKCRETARLATREVMERGRCAYIECWRSKVISSYKQGNISKGFGPAIDRNGKTLPPSPKMIFMDSQHVTRQAITNEQRLKGQWQEWSSLYSINYWTPP
jgi:hypothetical protein